MISINRYKKFDYLRKLNMFTFSNSLTSHESGEIQAAKVEEYLPRHS